MGRFRVIVNILQQLGKEGKNIDAPNVTTADCVVTGRPTMDTERTVKWLRDHHIAIPVYLRDDGVEHPTATDVGTWKADKAIELGCTHFVESDAEQAAIIASVHPARADLSKFVKEDSLHVTDANMHWQGLKPVLRAAWKKAHNQLASRGLVPSSFGKPPESERVV
jgi:hypothetical protein